MKWSLCLGLVVSASTYATFAQDVYLYKLSQMSLGLSAELEKIHGDLEPQDAALSSAVDDYPIDFADIGFSFPFYGNTQVRKVGISPNGVLKLDPFTPQAHPCKTSSFFACAGFDREWNAIAPFGTDLYPGPLRKLGTSSGTSKIYFYQGTKFPTDAFSAVWSRRKIVNPTANGITETQEFSFAVTLFPDGRITFYYGDVPNVSSVFQGDKNAIFAGLRAPSFMNKLWTRISANDRQLQLGWIALNGGLLNFKYAAGYLVELDHVKSGAKLELCLIPDHDLSTLLPEQICTIRNLVTYGGVLHAHFQAPKHFLGCLRVGIPLSCVFPDPANNNSTLTTNAFINPAASQDSILCQVPEYTVDKDLDLLELEYSFSSGMTNKSRRVLTARCNNSSASTTKYLLNSLCPVDDIFGEPLLLDCENVCGGGKVLDSKGTCCNSTNLDCRGVCAPEPLFRVAATKYMVGRNSFPSDQKECCYEPDIDCTGVCKGCIDCNDASASPDTCPTQKPTSAPTPYEKPSNTTPNIILLLLSLISSFVVFRLALFYFQNDEWVIERLMQVRSVRIEKLDEAEIEKYTRKFVFDEESEHSLVRYTKPAVGQSLDPEGGNSEEDGSSSEEKQICSVCICDFEIDDVCRELPCGHIFHAECIEEWFQRSTACAICRNDVRGNQDDPSADDQTLGHPAVEVQMESNR